MYLCVGSILICFLFLLFSSSRFLLSIFSPLPSVFSSFFCFSTSQIGVTSSLPVSLLRCQVWTNVAHKGFLSSPLLLFPHFFSSLFSSPHFSFLLFPLTFSPHFFFSLSFCLPLLSSFSTSSHPSFPVIFSFSFSSSFFSSLLFLVFF